MAGPTTTATDGTEAALIVVHDGGPDGEDDTALMWLTRAGQTLATVTNWCVNKFTPEGPPLPLTEGDVEVHDDPSAASPSPSEAGAFVAAAYTYGQRPPRKDTVVARLEDGEPLGEWSRIMPADGSGDNWGGPITCLVFDGSDAWLAGPATTATDGITEAAMIHLHDGGPGGENEFGVDLARSARTDDHDCHELVHDQVRARRTFAADRRRRGSPGRSVAWAYGFGWSTRKSMIESANVGESAGSWRPRGIVQSCTVAPDSQPDHSSTDVSAGSAPSLRFASTSTLALRVDDVSRHLSYVDQISAVLSARDGAQSCR